MLAIIRFEGGLQASIEDDGKWSSPNTEMAELLNKSCPVVFTPTTGRQGYSEALRAKELFGGIIEWPELPEREPTPEEANRIY